MNELILEELTYGELLKVSARFGAGSQVVLGHECDGTHTLVAVAAGWLRPSAGRALLNGARAWSNASARQGIAALGADEAALPARDVLGSVALALRARADARSAASVLDAAGLASWAARRVAGLSAREARALALALALSHPGPTLLALHEPLGLAGLVSDAFVLDSLRRFAASGAVVLSCVSRVEDAVRLGPVAGALELGRWLDASLAVLPSSQITLRVLTPEPRRLAARLAEAPDISGVEWPGGQELLIRGSELVRLASSVLRNARAEAIRITALKQNQPTLATLAAARAAWAAAPRAPLALEPRSP